MTDMYKRILVLLVLVLVIPTCIAEVRIGGIPTKNSVNVRKIPSKQGDIVGKLKDSEKIFVLEKEQDKKGNIWYRIEYGKGKKGYVLAEFIHLNNATAKSIPYASTPTPKPTKTPKPTPKPTRTPKPTSTPTIKPIKTVNPEMTGGTKESQLVEGNVINPNIGTYSLQKDYDSLEKLAQSVLLIEVYDSKNKEIGEASGFVAFDEHMLVTNYHVIEDAYTVKVRDEQERVYTLDSVAAYSEEDLAILRFPDGRNYESLSLNLKPELKRGQPVTTIGSPLGYRNTVSFGNISAFPEIDGKEMIQLTAPISSGSSGGVLLDEEGEVIGVTSAGATRGENIGFAIPVSRLNELYMKWDGVSFTKISDVNIKEESNDIFMELDSESLVLRTIKSISGYPNARKIVRSIDSGEAAVLIAFACIDLWNNESAQIDSNMDAYITSYGADAVILGYSVNKLKSVCIFVKMNGYKDSGVCSMLDYNSEEAYYILRNGEEPVKRISSYDILVAAKSIADFFAE